MEQEFTQTFYTNPLTQEDFPDPRIIEVQGQGYFAYATHDEFSPTLNNILVKRSMDLVHWSESKGALLAFPVWAKHCQKFWCPDIAKVNDQYRLYYAAEPDTKDGMCIALATSDHALGFTDSGAPINRLPGSSYEMIDPCFFVDPVSRRHFLYYGSAHQPIRVVELSPAGDSFISKPLEILFPGEGTFHKLREAAFVTYDVTWKRYFLWVSGDNTWAEKSYAVSVFWSSSPIGPFEPIPGDHVILKPNEFWDAPGHNCVIKDAAGNDWMFYHAVDVKGRFIPGTTIFLRKMCCDRVLYSDDGWPYVENSSPSFTRQNGPVVLTPPANGL